MMPCPYFLPTERCDAELWRNRRRLPLGDGWRGTCASAKPGLALDDRRIVNCNLGYARTCPHLPADHAADAVAFGIAGEKEGRVAVSYICERAYMPGEQGTLEFDAATRACINPHASASVQRLAECFLASYLARKR